MIDIRLPIGGLFTVLGLMLAGYGVITNGNEMYAIKSMGININLWWGLAMMVFGILMLLFGMRASGRKATAAAPQPVDEPRKAGIGH